MSDVASARRGKKDLYSNIALASVTLSAANTLTFSQLQISVGLFQGVALLLHRVLWWPTALTIREIVAATDSLYFGLVTSNRLTTIIDVTDPSIVTMQNIIGIAAGVERYQFPIVSDFSMLPGGGKLVPANPLFLAANTAGFAAAATVRAQLDFSFISLSDADYLELLQSIYPISV